jgi:hypothetical protein
MNKIKRKRCLQCGTLTDATQMVEAFAPGMKICSSCSSAILAVEKVIKQGITVEYVDGTVITIGGQEQSK